MAARNEESNPFSFSNFVHKPDETNTDESLVVVTQEGDSCDKNPFRFKNFQKKNDSLASNHSKSGKSKKLQIVEDLDSVTDIFANLPSPSVDDKSLKIKVKEEDEDIFAEDANLEGITFTSKITDGDNLSDASDDSSASPLTDSYLLSDPPQELNKKILEDLDQLKLQNAELIRELEMVKKKHRKENQASNQKISNLEKDLKKARKKEAEDTKALEDVVKMVEENLRKTTERALRAEANVSKLKEEIHILKEGNVSLADYKNIQMQHFHQLNTIKEKSQNAARLMRAAADKTEPQIRELQSGITSLRFLADTFDDIGMVSELPKKSDTNDR